MCSFRSCQTRFEFLSQFRKVRNAFECFVTQVQTRLPKSKCVWPMKINVICTVCPNIAPTIDQREIVLSLSILRQIYIGKFLNENDFSIILIPDLEKGKYFGKISDSQNISPLHKVECSQTNEIGFGYLCVC